MIKVLFTLFTTIIIVIGSCSENQDETIPDLTATKTPFIDLSPTPTQEGIPVTLTLTTFTPTPTLTPTNLPVIDNNATFFDTPQFYRNSSGNNINYRRSPQNGDVLGQVAPGEFFMAFGLWDTPNSANDWLWGCYANVFRECRVHSVYVAKWLLTQIE